MNHFNEEILERMAVNADFFDTEERDRIRSHIEKCTDCSAIFGYYADFYKDLGEYSEAANLALDEFVSGLTSVIPISPLKESAAKSEIPYLTVLAAMSTTQRSERFKLVTTLASEEQQAVVRILQDTDSQKLRFYVITHDPRKRANAVVSFPDISADFITDRRGQIEVECPIQDWNEARGYLRLYVAEHSIDGKELGDGSEEKNLSIDGTLHAVRLTYAANTLRILVNSRKEFAQDINAVVLENGAKGRFYIPLHDGRGECIIPYLSANLTVRLYC